MSRTSRRVKRAWRAARTSFSLKEWARLNTGNLDVMNWLRRKGGAFHA